MASFVLLPWGDGHGTVRVVGGVRHLAGPGIAGDAGRTMVASYYGYELEGCPTASGRPFDPEGYTAAREIGLTDLGSAPVRVTVL